nr:MAG TPA: hypothetical protein [Caudoviricetes sp.]
MYINANINGFNTPIEIPEVFAEREQIQTSDDSYMIKQGNLVEVGGVLTIQTTPVTNKPTGTGTEGSKRVDLSSYGFAKILNVQATAEDTPAGSIHENAHVGDVSNEGFAVYATSTHTAPVEFKVRYFVRAIV